jgi:hypothetical protein
MSEYRFDALPYMTAPKDVPEEFVLVKLKRLHAAEAHLTSVLAENKRHVDYLRYLEGSLGPPYEFLARAIKDHLASDQQELPSAITVDHHSDGTITLTPQHDEDRTSPRS